MIEIRQMKPAEMRDCARISAEAFDDYIFFTNYFPDAEKRRRFLNRMFVCEFRVNTDRGITFVARENGETAAVATLYPPEYKKPSDAAYLLGGWLGVMLAGGSRDVNAWNEMNTKNDAPCHEVRDAWYVNSLVVAPKYKRRGLGSRMIQECLIPYVRANRGKVLTLVTNSEENRCFYQKNGFTEFHARQFEYNGKRLGAWSYRIDL